MEAHPAAGATETILLQRGSIVYRTTSVQDELGKSQFSSDGATTTSYYRQAGHKELKLNGSIV